MRPTTVRVEAANRPFRGAGARRTGLVVLGLVALLACAMVATLSAAPARALPLLGPGGCGGLAQPDCPAAPAPKAAAPGDCTDSHGLSYIGTADQNPSDAIPMPRLGTPLIARRSDGHLPFGFNDPAYYHSLSDPNAGLSPAQDVAAHRRVGSTLTRMSLLWGWMERDRGSIDWAAVDQIYCANVRAGIGFVAVILTSPKWAVLGGQRCDGYCHSPPDSDYDGDLRAFAHAVAIRYPRVAAIEAWNEPNLSYFWHSPLPGGAGPDPARYTAVLKAVFEGVKSANAAIPILGGSITKRGTDSDDYSLGDFLSGMYDAGAQRWMDGLSFHPYPVNPRDSGRADELHQAFTTVRSLVAARDYAGRRLWPDEVGAKLADTPRPFTEKEQASDLLAYYRELDGAGDVDAIIFHTLFDPGVFGWLKPRDRQNRIFPRPVYCAFADRFGGALEAGQPAAGAPTPPAGAPKKKSSKKKSTTKKHARKRHRKHRKKHKRRVHHHRAHSTAERMDCSKPLALPAA